MKFKQYIWALYLMVFPFYFMNPGDPQVADLFGAILVLTSLKQIILSIKANRFNRFLFLFVMYALIVSIVTVFLWHDVMLIKNGLYYLYGYFIIMFLYSKFDDNDFLKFTLKTIGVVLIIQLLLYPFAPSTGIRAQMFFTNPNQLALWALCMLIISNVIATKVQATFLHTFILALLCSFFIFISASKSALVGAIIFWGYFFIQSKKYMVIIAPLVLFALIFVVSTKELDLSNIDFVNNVIERINEKKTSHNQGVHGRGYDRIYRFPEYLLFGAGEGNYERFGSHLELHSTFFSILFSYGVIGLYLILYGIFSIFKGSDRQTIVLFTALFMYSLMHMALRSPFFWMTLLALNQLRYYKTKTIEPLTNNEEAHLHSWR